MARRPRAWAEEASAVSSGSEADEPTPDQLLYERRLIAGLRRRALRARDDPKELFSFVMREEFGERRRIRAMPHQRVLFDFVSAHQRCVIRMFSGGSKTYCMTALTLSKLGNDPTERGVVISDTDDQAAKPIGLARDYIANESGQFPELGLVFPELRPSQRSGDPWTQYAITVDRPPGIRDPSFAAVGADGSLSGARLSWIFIDDLLSRKNTATPEARLKTLQWINTTVLSRRDIGTAQVVVSNTPWHSKDFTFVLEKAGWPTISIDIEGGIRITNTDWDSPDIRPAFRTEGPYHRLTAHDSAEYGAPLTALYPDGSRELVEDEEHAASARDEGATFEHFDIEEVIPTWPEKYGRKEINQLRRDYAGAMHEFNQLYMCICRDEDDARCKVEWVDKCKARALALGVRTLVAAYSGPNLTVTGVDLAIGRGTSNHKTCFFTHECMPDGRRRILDVEIGRFTGRQIVDKLKQKTLAYNSIARVETNAAQDFIRQWTLDDDASVPVRKHWTGDNKHDHSFGVESVFIAMENEAWLIPNDESGEVHPHLQQWIDNCIYYQPPPAHTGDALMASWLAAEQEREIMRGRFGGNENESAAAGIMSR